LNNNLQKKSSDETVKSAAYPFLSISHVLDFEFLHLTRKTIVTWLIRGKSKERPVKLLICKNLFQRALTPLWFLRIVNP
jgi:hypothetical protein